VIKTSYNPKSELNFSSISSATNLDKHMKSFKNFLQEQTELWGHHIDSQQKVFISVSPFIAVKNVKQTNNIKPDGLWYGCGDAWIQWVKMEMPDDFEAVNYLYEVKLGNDILKISNEDEFESFEHEFLRQDTPVNGGLPDWGKIQKEGYNGIEICPYFWSKRMSSLWYYPWDVASGCVWNANGISDVVLLKDKNDGIKV